MNTKNTKLSIISPVYGSSTLLKELVSRIHASVSRITENYEIILVEDNSPDNSWEIIKDICINDPHVIGLRLSRNFGQQNALTAGFDYASGDWIVTLDCDLQDEPEKILDLYNVALQGHDIVFASRQERQDGYIKKLSSRLFNLTLGYLTDTQQDHTIANYVLYSKNAVLAMKQLGDYYRYYPMLNRWVGFKTTTLAIPHAQRKDNIKSSYSFRKRLRLAFTTIVSFSDKPLMIVLKLGLLLVFLCFLLALYLIIRYVRLGISVSGWLSIFLSIWFLFGIVIIILGLLGVYMGKIFDSIKNRPPYIIREKAIKIS